jgi:hypothetical protein
MQHGAVLGLGLSIQILASFNCANFLAFNHDQVNQGWDQINASL